MNRPKITRLDAINLIPENYTLASVTVLGIRGYYKQTMGDPDENDRGIYDDAICIITPDLFETFNANTDPSIFRKGIAVLQPGIYMYKKGLHGMKHINMNNATLNSIYDKLIKTGKDVPGFTATYWALRQSGNVTIKRDQGKVETDSPSNRFYIDIHRGGRWSTSSEGCQTVIADQWELFKNTVFNLMDKYKQSEIPYILIEAK